MKVWWWEGKWHLSTNGSIDAFKTPANDIHSFGELFERALHNYASRSLKILQIIYLNLTLIYLNSALLRIVL